MKKSIFITGAASGIGKETAMLFANKGWHVGLTDVDETGLERMKNKLEKNHFYAVLNVTELDDIKRVLSEFNESAGGKIDVLFNNAGVAEVDPFEKTSLQKHVRLIEINTKGVLHCTYLALPYLKKAGGASIVNMSSAAANYGVPDEATYSGTKFFVRGFTEALNVELEQYQIHVCDIMPNYVDTPMVAAVSGTIVDNVGVALKPKDVADTVWKAVHKKKIHWHVDRLKFKIVQKLMPVTPNFIHRKIMKDLAGY